LLEAMMPIVSHPPRWDAKSERLQVSNAGSTRIMLSGVWGGTLEAERSPLWNVPISEAVEQLERTFPVRLARFARAFEGSRAQRRAQTGRPARAKALLAKPEVAVLLAVTGRRCPTCSRRLPALCRADARYCGVRCRVAACQGPGGVNPERATTGKMAAPQGGSRRLPASAPAGAPWIVRVGPLYFLPTTEHR
jgi:hypothetical protein